MNKQIISLTIIFASSIILSGCTKQKEATTQTQSKTVSEATEFANAIQSGKPTICIMTKDKVSMEYQIKNKMMHMVSTTTSTDDKGVATTIVGHMINDNKLVYTWDEKTKQGAKMAIPTEEEVKDMTDKAKELQDETATTPKFESEEDYRGLKNDGYTINCKNSSVDDSVFMPPTDIKFIDPTAMMKAIPSPDANGKFDMTQLEELQKKYGGE